MCFVSWTPFKLSCLLNPDHLEFLGIGDNNSEKPAFKRRNFHFRFSVNAAHFIFTEKISDKMVQLMNLKPVNDLIKDEKLPVVMFKRNCWNTKCMKRICSQVLPKLLDYCSEKIIFSS